MNIKNYKNLFKTLLGFCMIVCFLIGNSISALGQPPPGITISWDKEVGCQIYDFEDGEIPLFLENIESSDCIQVCENSEVTYTLDNVPSSATIIWNIVGGTTSNNTSSSCTVDWGATGAGSISFTVTDGSYITSKTICIEKIVAPTALFDIAPFGQNPLTACVEQQIYFTNLSSTNNGTDLVSHVWDFGDGNTSTAFEPSHTYMNPGGYEVSLIVKNECNCTDTFKMKVDIGRKGFEIACPSVVCEGTSAIYALPPHVISACAGNYNWSVIGGQIVDQSDEQVEILWNDIDENGFGYVTFDPTGICDLYCISPTTVKVPIIQSQGTIKGVESICLGGQGRYKLPQWPTTEIQWEIVGNVGNNIGQILQTDQRNEVIVEPYMSGSFILRATYINTLLGCGGEAEFEFNVLEPLDILGENVTCQGDNITYTNSSGSPANWTLTSNVGTIITTQNNVTNFDYTFDQAGNYILTVSKAGYCTDQGKTITVLEKPEAPSTIIGDLFACVDATYLYEIQNPDPLATYFWEIPSNGSIVGSNEGEEVNITFTGFQADILVYKKSNFPVECASDALVVTIDSLPINAEISSDMIEVCSSTLADYFAFETGTTNLYTEGDDYIWSFANASPSTIPANSLGSVSSGQGTNQIEVTWNNVAVPTTVDLVLEIVKCNTVTQFTRQITISPKTEIELITDPNPVCANGIEPLIFTVQSIDQNTMPLIGNESITWNFGDGSFTTPPGQFTYSYNFSNNTNGNLDFPVSAYISSGNCGVSNTAHAIVTVMPNPSAMISLSSGEYSVCDESEIDASLIVSSNTSGVGFQWYHNNTLIPGETSTSINITPTMMGVGSYKVHATNANGCISASNTINLNIKDCDYTSPDCTTNVTIENNSYFSGCGEITLDGGVTSGTGVISSGRSIIGLPFGDYSINGNILTGAAGTYTIRYYAVVPCDEGGQTTITKDKTIVIPYHADFVYSVVCNGDNTFDVNFIDQSVFLPSVTNQSMEFYYKLVGATNPWIPVNYEPSLSEFEIEGLTAGNYIFRQVVNGDYLNTPSFTCIKEYEVNLEVINQNSVINIISNFGTIPCHNTAVEFGLNPFSIDYNYLWDFEEEALNSMISPSRVFNVPGNSYNVSVEVTNTYGCTGTFNKFITIPEECFFGDIVAVPGSATVCKNETVDLTYVPNGDNCDVTTYVWMDGNNPVIGAPNSPTLTVSTSGFYWVKVKSQDECEYSSPTQIKPVFEPLPMVKLFGESTACVDGEMKYKVFTNGETIKWYVGTTVYNQFDDLTEADFTGLLSTGTHVITVEVMSENGCTNTASINVNVESPLTSLDVALLSYNCSPVEITLMALPNPNTPNINYNWSNGSSTQMITVNDGGPYKVTASIGGCSISEEIFVPRHPENYMWIYPTGCHIDCYPRKDLPYNYLIGPTLPLSLWSWNQDDISIENGNNSYQTPFYLTSPGYYTSTINTGYCSLESEPLEYKLEECEECIMDMVNITDVSPSDANYCGFIYTISIDNAMSIPLTNVSITDNYNNVVITSLVNPLVINPGTNTYQFLVIPISPFNGGSTTWTLEASYTMDSGVHTCVFSFDAHVPACKNDLISEEIDLEKSIITNFENLLQVYPNPAKDFATVKYEIASENALLEVYDLLGRSLYKQNLTTTRGELRLDTNHLVAGVYIVVIKQENGILLQQKLIIE